MISGNGDKAARAARWKEYVETLFSKDPQESGTKPEGVHRPESMAVTWHVGMLAFIPLSGDEDSLPMGHYFVMTDPQKPIVNLALARRDGDGYTVPSEHTIVVARERLAEFKPVAGFPGY